MAITQKHRGQRMALSIIQWIIIIFALFAWSRAILRLKDGEIKFKEFLFWTLLWAGLVVITIFQRIPQYLSNLFGIGRGVDLVVYISIILLFYLIFRMYVKIDSMEQEMTKIVREVALSSKKKK